MKKKRDKNRFYKIKQSVILFLSLYVVAEFFVALIVRYSLQTELILEAVDFIICFIFIADIIYEAWRSGSKLITYARQHLLDIVSSIPFLTSLRLLRVLKIIKLIRALRIFKLLRGFKGVGQILNFATENKMRSMLSIYTLLMIMILLFCSAGFFMFEKGVNPNVTSYFDSLWWSFMTASSIGDAIIFPTTTEGRIFAAILIISGLGLFSLITGDISSTFVMHYMKQKNKKKKIKKYGRHNPQ